jgi:hypothetical protein
MRHHQFGEIPSFNEFQGHQRFTFLRFAFPAPGERQPLGWFYRVIDSHYGMSFSIRRVHLYSVSSAGSHIQLRDGSRKIVRRRKPLNQLFRFGPCTEYFFPRCRKGALDFERCFFFFGSHEFSSVLFSASKNAASALSRCSQKPR